MKTTAGTDLKAALVSPWRVSKWISRIAMSTISEAKNTGSNVAYLMPFTKQTVSVEGVLEETLDSGRTIPGGDSEAHDAARGDWGIETKTDSRYQTPNFMVELGLA
jgi:hypothetical protein